MSRTCLAQAQSEQELAAQELSVERALSQRPEIQAMDAKIEMAREGMSLAKSGRLPFVALVAGYHHYEPENETPSAEVGLVAGIKLYDHGMVKHEIAEARDALKKANTEKKELQRGIQLEVEQAFCNAEVAFKTVDVASGGGTSNPPSPCRRLRLPG